MLRSLVRKLAIVAVGLALLVFAVRSFIGDVYRVTSRSMNPTLWGDPESGDFVWVTFGGVDSVARYDLVVLRRDGEAEPYVKRVAGLPGESVQVRGGDLFVGGALLGSEASRPAPIVVFDLALHPLESLFGCPNPEAWIEDGALRLTEEPGPDELSTALATVYPILDDGLDPNGASVGGVEEVNDLIVELAVVIDDAADACGALELELTEEDDRFRLDVRWAGTRAELVLSRLIGEGPATELARTESELAPGPLPIRLANVDNHLTVLLGGVRALEHSYDSNESIVDRPGPTPVHRKPRIALRGRAKPAFELTELRVLRDLVYTRQGDYGTREPVALGPGEVFLLGDSSPASRDGRMWGPVPLEDLLGRPRAVVWPLARARVLPRLD